MAHIRHQLIHKQIKNTCGLCRSVKYGWKRLVSFEDKRFVRLCDFLLENFCCAFFVGGGGLNAVLPPKNTMTADCVNSLKSKVQISVMPFVSGGEQKLGSRKIKLKITPE